MTNEEAAVHQALRMERETETHPGQRMLPQRLEYLKAHSSGFNHIREMAAEIERLQDQVQIWKKVARS